MTFKSADELRQALLEEFKDYIDQGLLTLPAPGREITLAPRSVDRPMGWTGYSHDK